MHRFLRYIAWLFAPLAGLGATMQGYDAHGRIVGLVTDFNVVDWSKAKW